MAIFSTISLICAEFGLNTPQKNDEEIAETLSSSSKAAKGSDAMLPVFRAHFALFWGLYRRLELGIEGFYGQFAWMLAVSLVCGHFVR
ncbi:MAG: hypothetical protein J6R42_03070 [Clostridia bacterium]|nr:hypothetical protein [Clostridia bacterium]